MRLGDLVKITSKGGNVEMVAVFLDRTYHDALSFRFMYDGGKIAEFDTRFWKIEFLA